MKKIFILPAGLILALSFQSCQNTADDGSAQQRIDSTVNARIVTLRDSMMMECNNMVMSAAQAQADSIMMAMNNAGSSKGKGGKTTTTSGSGSTTTTGGKDSDKLKDKVGGDEGGKLKDKIGGSSDTSRTKSKKLKDRIP